MNEKEFWGMVTKSLRLVWSGRKTRKNTRDVLIDTRPASFQYENFLGRRLGQTARNSEAGRSAPNNNLRAFNKRAPCAESRNVHNCGIDETGILELRMTLTRNWLSSECPLRCYLIC